ncbi:MAG: cobyrinate a,c-diamide synthase [Tissierellia bacterium]|nr:cobyrinate a,c-diamide synthase [Tissierellia bacterium]
MKGIMITSPSSGQGKTTFTMGLCRLFKNKNYEISPFKTGPDFIDPKFHSFASGRNSGNLDLHMQSEEGMKLALSLNKSEYAIIEGAMGYFDGIDNGFIGSSFDISNRLGIPALMIISPGAQMFSLIPKLIGMSDFSKGRIKGVILNKISSNYYKKIKVQIERYTDLKVLGYIEDNPEFSIESRHIGLLMPSEIEGLDKSLDKIANIIENNIDIKALMDLFEEIPTGDYLFKETGKRVLLAKDDAFCFHYNENLRILEKVSDLNYFSPLKGDSIPEADLMIIGGGYPELYLEELSKNEIMKRSIRNFSESGAKILGMGAGLMYLSESIDGYEMVGALPGKAFMTEKTQRFGYNTIELLEDCILGDKGTKMNAKEFHKSIFKTNLKPIFRVEKADGRTWSSGYNIRNTTVMYQHLNFAGDIRLGKILGMEEDYVY